MSKTEREFSHLLSIGARIIVWGGLFSVVYILRSFFLLMFLTFVFSYMQAHAVQHLKSRIKSRPLRVTLVGVIFLGLIVTVSSYLVPYIKTQAKNTITHIPEYIRTIDRHLLDLAKDSNIISFAIGLSAEDLDHVNEIQPESEWDASKSPTLSLLQSMIGGNDEEEKNGEIVKYLTGKVTNLGTTLLGAMSSFLLSVLFSFLIVLDLPRLTKSVKDLSHTKVAFIYEEVAGSIAGFGRELGRAFEAQAMIALLNTVLTAIGLWILGITGKIAFLSVIVFFCSFIPIAGVFISSIPICLMALQSGGFWLMFLAILLITVIHMIEAYVLNPKIYGQHMHINPVLVLAILTTCGKVFGVWGFLLGLPVSTYIFRHAIRYEDSKKGEEGRDNLQPLQE
ncbi:MAG: AI-2E family transporter [Bdellovibrionota bacterium]|jgi:predicted PurR-regulated permease PerM